MSLQVALSHPLSWLRYSIIYLAVCLSIYLYITYTLFIHLLINICFHIFVMVKVTVLLLHIHFDHIVGDFFRIDCQKWNYCPRTEIYKYFTDISCTYFYIVDTANTQGMSCCILILTYPVSIRVSLNIDFLKEGKSSYILYPQASDCTKKRHTSNFRGGETVDCQSRQPGFASGMRLISKLTNLSTL